PMQLFAPFVTHSFVGREIARGRDDQLRTNRLQEFSRARYSGMMLSFDNDVATQVEFRRQQGCFGGKTTVRHEKNTVPVARFQLYDQRLVIALRSDEPTGRIKNQTA